MQLLLGQKVTIWLVTWVGGGLRQMVTSGDKGGEGVKNRDFYGDILFEWPLIGTNFYNEVFEM